MRADGRGGWGRFGWPPAHRTPVELLIALSGVVLAAAAMLPLRAHLALATSAIVFVLPVAAAAAVGGFRAGASAVVAGFLAFDLLFIPPYGRLSVQHAQDWVVLVVYGAVMLVVARILGQLRRARAEVGRRERHARELLELSDVLIGEHTLPQLFEIIVSTLQRALSLRSAALLLPADNGAGPLEVVACAGAPLDEEQVRAARPVAGEARRIGGAVPGTDGLAWTALVATGRPVGVLAIAGQLPAAGDWELLRTYANHAALALERSRLREQAVQIQVAEEADRWRLALLGAVSHDLRTPLATVKAALSDLRRADLELGRDVEQELLALAEDQSDRLDRLVANLLDMTQIQAGALRPRRRPVNVDELVAESLEVLGPAWPGRIATSLPLTLPPVEVDRMLVVQVLTNLLDNAVRHAPTGDAVRVAAVRCGAFVEVAVEDRGPGVPTEERERIFVMFNRVMGGGRAGLGLTIAKTFIEANGGTIRVEERDGGGARFVFTLPVAGGPPERAAGPIGEEGDPVAR